MTATPGFLIAGAAASDQRGAAENLISATKTGMAPFPDQAAIEAAGYTSIGDGRPGGYERFVNFAYLADLIELDASHPARSRGHRRARPG